MKSLLISSAWGGSLEFLERTPADTKRPLEAFVVRLTGPNLSAVGPVFAGYPDAHPAGLFARMSADWRGWQGEYVWGALEQEFELRCTQDRAGHVTIRVALRSGPTDNDWEARATIMAEAGQLEEIAQHASAFFGRSRPDDG